MKHDYHKYMMLLIVLQDVWSYISSYLCSHLTATSPVLFPICPLLSVRQSEQDLQSFDVQGLNPIRRSTKSSVIHCYMLFLIFPFDHEGQHYIL